MELQSCIYIDGQFFKNQTGLRFSNCDHNCTAGCQLVIGVVVVAWKTTGLQ